MLHQKPWRPVHAVALSGPCRQNAQSPVAYTMLSPSSLKPLGGNSCLTCTLYCYSGHGNGGVLCKGLQTHCKKNVLKQRICLMFELHHIHCFQTLSLHDIQCPLHSTAARYHNQHELEQPNHIPRHTLYADACTTNSTQCCSWMCI